MSELTEQIPHLTGNHGIRIVQALVRAAFEEARKDAHVNKNGDVDICTREVEGMTLSHPDLISELKNLFETIYPAVHDQVTHEKRVSWQADKDLEKRLSGLDSVKKLELEPTE